MDYQILGKDKYESNFSYRKIIYYTRNKTKKKNVQNRFLYFFGVLGTVILNHGVPTYMGEFKPTKSATWDFVLGLYNDIEIIESAKFKEFIRKNIKDLTHKFEY